MWTKQDKHAPMAESKTCIFSFIPDYLNYCTSWVEFLTKQDDNDFSPFHFFKKVETDTNPLILYLDIMFSFRNF